MSTGIRWMATLAAAGLLVATAFGVAGATGGSDTAGPESEYEHGAMLGDVDQDRDRDRIHVDDVSASAVLEADKDQIQLRLRDGSCQEETAIASEEIVSAQEQMVTAQERVRTRTRAGD